jgi:hypothetical protein
VEFNIGIPDTATHARLAQALAFPILQHTRELRHLRYQSVVHVGGAGGVRQTTSPSEEPEASVPDESRANHACAACVMTGCLRRPCRPC